MTIKAPPVEQACAYNLALALEYWHRHRGEPRAAGLLIGALEEYRKVFPAGSDLDMAGQWDASTLDIDRLQPSLTHALAA